VNPANPTALLSWSRRGHLSEFVAMSQATTPTPGIWHLFESQASKNPEGLLAVDETGRTVTYGKAHSKANKLAAELERQGVVAGSVVSWLFPNSLDAVVLSLALSRLCAVQNPLISILRDREIRFICTQAKTQLLVVPATESFVSLAKTVAAEIAGLQVIVLDEMLAELPNRNTSEPKAVAPIDGSTISWYFYTSGTTADPKGAMHTDASMIAGSQGFVDALSIGANDRVSLIIPLTHVGGIIHVIAALLTGGPIVSSSTFDPIATPLYLRGQGATTIPGSTPFVLAYLALAEARPDLRPLFPKARMMLHGGSPKPPHLHFQVKEHFGTAGIISGYGMTECPMAIWNRPEDSDEELSTSEGRPVPGVRLRIVATNGDFEGRDLPIGEEGEIRLHGPQLMRGYVDSSLDVSSFDAQGFFCSGDLGVVDANGRLKVTGRLKDIIIRNMENVSALEVENLIFTHPLVRETAVIGVPDSVTGERVCAVVVPKDAANPPTLLELQTHLIDQGLSKRKLPERLELVDALPRNAMEKVRKVDLRARFSTPVTDQP
jgi:acyl-CoA synthetase (AMP-forming)/AMP-acid ligase II